MQFLNEQLNIDNLSNTYLSQRHVEFVQLDNPYIKKHLYRVKIPYQYLPVLILNKNYLIDLEEKTKDTFKWIQNRIKNIINNFIEHVFQEEL